MRRVRREMCLALAAILLLTGCDGAGSKGSATPEAAVQFAELRAEIDELALTDWMAEACPTELPQVVQNFIETADPRFTSENGKYNILHLACMLKKPELARCLLLDGADPNTPTMIEGSAAESPLLLAIASDYAPQVPAEQINKLIDILVAAGASLATPGSVETALTYNTCLTCAHEAVYAHLLDIGTPRSGNELQEVAYRGWLSTLKRLIDECGGFAPEHHALLPGVARLSGGYYDGEHQACALYLLEQGCPVDATDALGRTALFCLADTIASLQSDEQIRTAVELAVLLLNHGADPYLRADKDPEHPGFSAYDLLAATPAILEELKAKGHELKAPPINIRSGEHLAADVCRAAMLHAPAEVIAPHFTTIARLLTPDEQLRQQEIYADALRNAIILLSTAHAEKTAAAIADMPLWQQLPQTASHITDSFISALQDCPNIILPGQLLINAAEQLLTADDHEHAASLIELLGRSAQNDEIINTLCQDPRLPIQAGAWGARLTRAGLPSACNGSIAAWLSEQQRNADTPTLRKALLLTSIEDLWYGNMTDEQISTFVSTIQELGATQAADMYRAIADNLSNPEKLDELMTTQDIWSYELEIATAKFLLEHREEILTPTTPAP